MEGRRYWQQRLREVAKRRIQIRTLAAFNANVDVIVHVTPEAMARLLEKPNEIDPIEMRRAAESNPAAVRTKSELVGVLKACLARGKSYHLQAADQALLDWLEAQFPAADRSMGGQAGIISNQMAMLGATSRAYCPLLSEAQAALFVPGVEVPAVVDGRLQLRPARAAARPADPTKINWIFEYARGLTFRFGEETVTAPRANRVILSSAPKAIMEFETALRPFLAELALTADVAFLAGYHHAAPRMPDGRDCACYLADAVADIRALRRGNPALRVHYEYVSMKHEEVEAMTLAHIGAAVHSFGINEVEIKRVLERCGFPAAREAIEASEDALSLYRGALTLLSHLGLERIQVHNLGYYVLVVKKPYPVSLCGLQSAALFGSAVNASKARTGGYVTPEQLAEAAQTAPSEAGFEQLARFGAAAPGIGLRPVEEGIWEGPDHYALIIPAHIVPHPVSTVGMGDTISSATFALEVEVGREVTTGPGR